LNFSVDSHSDNSSHGRVVSTVLGVQPPSKSHSAILLNDEKILVVEKGVSLNYFIWLFDRD
jgi:guanylate kinase